jgi:hypothetical protein
MKATIIYRQEEHRLPIITLQELAAVVLVVDMLELLLN